MAFSRNVWAKRALLIVQWAGAGARSCLRNSTSMSTITIAIMKERRRESSGAKAPACKGKAIVVLTCLIVDALDNNLLWEWQHHDGRSKE